MDRRRDFRLISFVNDAEVWMCEQRWAINQDLSTHVGTVLSTGAHLCVLVISSGWGGGGPGGDRVGWPAVDSDPLTGSGSVLVR